VTLVSQFISYFFSPVVEKENFQGQIPAELFMHARYPSCHQSKSIRAEAQNTDDSGEKSCTGFFS